MPYVIPSPRGAGGVVGVRCDEPARPVLYSRTFGDAPLSHIESRNSQPKNLNLIPATFSTALKRAMVTTTTAHVHTYEHDAWRIKKLFVHGHVILWLFSNLGLADSPSMYLLDN